MKKLLLHILILFCLPFLVSGCRDDASWTGKPGDNGMEADEVQLEIFTRADSYHLPKARGTENEDVLGKTPWVLVFKGDTPSATFVEARQAFEMAGKRFVILTKQPTGSKYQLLILANPLNNKFYYGDATTAYNFDAAGIASKITTATTLSDVCANLMTEPLAAGGVDGIPYTGVGEAIPMSYLLTVNSIDNTTRIENADKSSLEMIRVVAKMMVVNKASNFDFTGITTIINVPRQGRLHNLDGTIMNNASNLTEYRYDNSYSAPLVAAASQSTVTEPIYIYESDKLNNTHLIIEGVYEGKPYFYKMAIVDNVIQKMDIYRNHAYTFTITKVKGPGYDTIEDAKVAPASNMYLDYTVLIDDSNSYEIMSNNDYYLAVSNSVFMAYSSGGDYEAFKIITDCDIDFPNSRSITTNEQEVESSFTLIYPWDHKIPIVSGVSPSVTPVGVHVGDWLMYNEEGQSLIESDGSITWKKNAYVTLKLGNLEKMIHIRQRPPIPDSGRLLKYEPYAGNDPSSEYVNYYCLSGEVAEAGDDNPRTWIKLRPSSMEIRQDTARITVDDGKIYIEVAPNTSGAERAGVVYLSTIKAPDASSPSVNTTQRVKISITQE